MFNRSNLVLFICLFIGVCLSFGGFFFVKQTREELLYRDVTEKAKIANNFLSLEVSLAVNSLVSLQSFFVSSEHVSREEFVRFLDNSAYVHKYIKALEWVPAISNTHIDQFSQSYAQNVYEGYHIKQSQLSESNHDEVITHYPVFYIYPLHGNEQALGFNLASSRTRLNVIQESIELGAVRSTEVITLVQSSTDYPGLLMILPVDNSSVHSYNAEKNEINTKTGLVVGVFIVADLIAPFLEENKRLFGSFNVYLNEKGKNEKIFKNENGTGNVSFYVRDEVSLPGRPWEIEIIPVESYVSDFIGYFHVVVLLVGLFLSSILTLWVKNILSRDKEIQILVENKTRELEILEHSSNTIIEAAVDGIITISEKGIISRVNPAAEKMFGYSFDELVGRNVNCLMPEPYHSQHDLYLANYLESGNAKIIGVGREVEGRRKNGEVFPMHLSVGVAGAEEDRRFVGIIKDMSIEKEIRKNLIKAKEVAEQSAKQQIAFINTTSHELRTPLTVILGYIPLLKKKSGSISAEAIQNIANQMDISGKHLLCLINDILDYSKLGAGALSLNKSNVSLVDILNEISVMFETQANKKHVSLICECENAVVELDRKRVIQILTNLVGNSLKFTHEGSIRVDAVVTGGEVKFVVKDTGIGIPSEHLDSVFDAFHQVDSSSTRTAGGTGLGLAITKQLVLMHDGEITLNSQLGEGTEVTFSLKLTGDNNGNTHC